MADGEATGEYSLILPDGSVLQKSRGYTGQAKAQYASGDSYEGDFLDGLRHGKATYTYSNGDKFTGVYVNNKRHGLGRLEFSAGGFYHGNWSEGKRHGLGTEKYANNDVYSGLWANGKKQGKGTYAYAGTRAKLIGDWVSGKLNEGEWVWNNGTTYIGKFKNNKPTGEGRWVFPAGTQLKGSYTQTLVPVDEVERNRRKIRAADKAAAAAAAAESSGAVLVAAPAIVIPTMEYKIKWKTTKVGSVEEGFAGEDF